VTTLESRILLIASLTVSLGAAAQPVASTPDEPSAERFDGTWDATVSCSDVNENDPRARGYVLQFPVEVKQGILRGQHGSQNVSGWLKLEGRIESDGGARLVARGLTGDPDYALGRVQRSSPYVYSVTAHFDAARGSGQRVELRPCQLTFVKRG
jgi:hypothetical protein